MAQEFCGNCDTPTAQTFSPETIEACRGSWFCDLRDGSEFAVCGLFAGVKAVEPEAGRSGNYETRLYNNPFFGKGTSVVIEPVVWRLKV